MGKNNLINKIDSILPLISIFGGVNKVEKEIFISKLYEESYKEGDVIFKEGSSPTDSYILLSGEVVLKISGRRVDKFGPGIIFGIDSPIGIQKQLTTAIADSDITIAVIPKMTLYKLAEENPLLFGKIILNMARELARSIKSMKEIIDDFISLEKTI